MSVSMNIDEEWENFISSGCDDDISSDDEDINEILKSGCEDFVSANLQDRKSTRLNSSH